jgi:PHD/YefM family antitoxin component YafN of YafNO toxin-antitoxin module
MDLNEIKKLIEIDGGKFIIVENGEPVMVMMSFEEYRKKLNLKEEKPIVKETKELPKELEEEELKVEDLPL